MIIICREGCWPIHCSCWEDMAAWIKAVSRYRHKIIRVVELD